LIHGVFPADLDAGGGEVTAVGERDLQVRQTVPVEAVGPVGAPFGARPLAGSAAEWSKDPASASSGTTIIRFPRKCEIGAIVHRAL
jgi:hypothetical protein